MAYPSSVGCDLGGDQPTGYAILSACFHTPEITITLINDTYGHEAGDAVLREVGRLLLAEVRESDIAARIGGEEFAVLLPESSQEHAMELAERLRNTLDSLKVRYTQTMLRPTASFGVAMLSPDDDRLESLLSRADEAMYLSKADGRNRVHLFPQF